MNSYFDFTGKTAVVTGGGSGIGRAAAHAFAAAGANVFLFDINKEGLKGTEDLILQETAQKAESYTCDVSDEEAVGQAVRKILEQMDRIDILVNCAGIATGDRPGQDMTVWKRTLDVNLTGQWNMIKAVLPAMVGQKYGRIVNISSINARCAFKHLPLQPYYATKAGSLGLTKGVAAYYARDGITCNAVMPGMVETQMIKDWTPELRQAYNNVTPIGRGAQPEEICGAILFLASDAASYITGAELAVDGGAGIV